MLLLMCPFRILFLALFPSSFLLSSVESKVKQCKAKEPCKWIDDECTSKSRSTIARCAPGKICRNYQYTKRSEVCPLGYKLDRTVRCKGNGQNEQNYKHFCCKDNNNYTVSGLPYLTPQDYENGQHYPDIGGVNIPQPHDPVAPRNATKNVLVYQSRWPYAEIPYYINNTQAGWTVAQRAEIAKAIKNYEDNTCIRFHAASYWDYGWVSIINDPTVNTATNCGLSQICGPYGGSQFCSVGPSCANAEWLVHELGHSLCFHHEHQRTDRDDYIYFDSNIRGCSAYNYPKFEPPQWSTLNLPYDYDSIMMYPGCRDYTCFKRQPWQPGSGPCGEAGNGYGRLSRTDIVRMNLFYGCDCSIYSCAV